MNEATIEKPTQLRRSMGLSMFAMLGLTMLIYFPVLVTSSMALVPFAAPESGFGAAMEGMFYGDRLRCSALWHLPFLSESVRCNVYLQQFGASGIFAGIMLSCLSLAAIIGCSIGWKMTTPPDRVKHVRGRELLIDEEAEDAIREWSHSEPNHDLEPLDITEDWRMSNDRECEHFLDLGGTGGGKTQLFVRLYGAAMNRGDRIVLHDVKGDFVSFLPNAFLLSPTDERSGIWDIAKDVDSPPLARELCAFLIPHSGKEKIWVNAARSIATGYIVYLQKTKGNNWTWADLATINMLDESDFKRILGEYWREAKKYVKKADSTTTQGFISEVGAHLYIFTDLANAWHDPKGTRPKVSLRQWMYRPREDQQVMILARNSAYDELSTAWVSAVVHMLCTLGVSPEMPESRTNRIWLGLDEAWAMNKQPKLTEIIRLGRSKGIIAVIGAQSSLQLEDIYGEKVVQDWFNNFGTVIVSKHKLGTAADKAAALVGQRQIEKIHDSASMKDHETQSTSYSYRGEMERVVLPSQLNTLLGSFENAPGWFRSMFGARSAPFIRILILGYGDLAPMIRFSILEVEKFRKGFVAAEWTKGQNYRQPDEIAALNNTQPVIDPHQPDLLADEPIITDAEIVEEEAPTSADVRRFSVGDRKLFIVGRGNTSTLTIVSKFVEQTVRKSNPTLFSGSDAPRLRTTLQPSSEGKGP